MPPKPTPPVAHAHRTQRALAAADLQRKPHKGRPSTDRDGARPAHPARHTKRRAARKRRGLKAQRSALSPKQDKGLRGQQAALRPAGRAQDPLQAQINRDAAREGEPAAGPRDAAYYRQHPDLVPPKAVRAQMREDDLPAELVKMDEMPIEAELTLGEQTVLNLAGKELFTLWREVATNAARDLFQKLVVKALGGPQVSLVDKAQDVFFGMLPGPVGKVRKSMEGMAKAASPKPEAAADAVVHAFIHAIEKTTGPSQKYVSDHQLEAAKMVKDRDGRISAKPSDYHDVWLGAPFFLPGPDAVGIRANIDVQLQALYYQAMAQATCDAGAGAPGLCYPEKLADPARWRADAKRAVLQDPNTERDERLAILNEVDQPPKTRSWFDPTRVLDGKVNYAKDKMHW